LILAAEGEVVEKDDGVVVADGGFEQPFDVVGGAGHDDFDQGQVHKEGVDRLAVVGAGADAAAVLGHKDDGQPGLSAEHIAHGGGLVGDLVEGQVEKGAEHQVDDRAQPGGGGADTGAGDTQLGDGGVDDPGVAELGVQPACAGEDAEPDILADQDDVGVLAEFFGQSSLNGSDIGFAWHSYTQVSS
jgi:hypothetical protein